LAIVDDRRQALFRPAPTGGIGGHGDDPRVKATEEGDDKVESRGEEQQSALAFEIRFLKPVSESARTAFEFSKGEFTPYLLPVF
jgi:hypothetical protein